MVGPASALDGGPADLVGPASALVWRGGFWETPRPMATQTAIQPDSIQAAVFDFGGVLIEGGPGEVRAFGGRVGLAPEVWDPLRREIFANVGPWSELECGKTTYDDFVTHLMKRVTDAGGKVDRATASTFMGAPDPMGQYDHLRHDVIDAVARLHDRMPTALLTNNIVEWRGGWHNAMPLERMFDVVIDSSEVGTRKPEPEIYEITRERLDVPHESIFFLDDIGQNLKAARALGWQTVLYADPAEAMSTLETLIAAHAWREQKS
ncbi:MAG: putative hydrolase of the HAD superfamily [Hyphomicrobiaceae bacterium]